MAARPAAGGWGYTMHERARPAGPTHNKTGKNRKIFSGMASYGALIRTGRAGRDLIGPVHVRAHKPGPDRYMM